MARYNGCNHYYSNFDSHLIALDHFFLLQLNARDRPRYHARFLICCTPRACVLHDCVTTLEMPVTVTKYIDVTNTLLKRSDSSDYSRRTLWITQLKILVYNHNVISRMSLIHLSSMYPEGVNIILAHFYYVAHTLAPERQPARYKTCTAALWYHSPITITKPNNPFT